jgi:RND family efflux transporter MFP subunit|tara:strand:+ start:5434 stop:6582 length:1149 start_codon:yes stop_codon:yes gene_type:complete
VSEEKTKTGREKLTGLLQLIAVIVFVGLAVVYSQAPDESATQSTYGQVNASKSAAPLVSVVRPQLNTHSISISGNGSVTIRAYVDLAPQVSGVVASISPALRAGGTFKANEILVSIDTNDFKLRLKQAQAEVGSARSNLQLQQAKSDSAKRNYALLHPNKPVPPLVALQPQISQARALLAGATAKADIAKLDLARTSISLPFDGKITQSTAEIGQLLSSGKTFGRAFALSAIELVVPLAATDIAALSPIEGRIARLSILGKTLQRKVERVSAELDARSRFARAFIPVNLSADIQPGVFVDVQLDGPKIANTFVLPESASQANDSVWLVREGLLEKYQPVVRGRSEAGLIVDGFDYGDGIVLGAIPGAEENQQVRARSFESSN